MRISRVWLAVLVGCAGPSGGGHTDVDTDVDTQVAAPLLADAGLCELPDRPWMSVRPGQDLARLTLEDPLAKCNDGSPGVLYVSAAPEGSPDSDRWVVWLEGGGGCLDGESCADRWCGRGGLTDSPGKMSSRWAPEGIEGGGIFDRGPGNPFRGWNHVMAYYCSSDNWSGTQSLQIVDEAGERPPYTLVLHGAHLVDAMVDALKAGADSDDGSVALPSIDGATQVLFMGTSAGGGGARYNADHVAESLRASNADVDVRLVVDAGFHPKDPAPPEVSEADSEAFYDRAWDVTTNFRAGRVDASCVAFHDEDPAICAEPTHTLVHHIQTPWFVKMDLSDGANTPGIYPDDRSFTQAVYGLVTSLRSRSAFAEEYPDLQPAAFAPNCGHHVNLEVPAFQDIVLTDGTRRVSNARMLSAWATDSLPGPVLVHEPEAGWTSECGR